MCYIDRRKYLPKESISKVSRKKDTSDAINMSQKGFVAKISYQMQISRDSRNG